MRDKALVFGPFCVLAAVKLDNQAPLAAHPLLTLSCMRGRGWWGRVERSVPAAAEGTVGSSAAINLKV